MRARGPPLLLLLALLCRAQCRILFEEACNATAAQWAYSEQCSIAVYEDGYYTAGGGPLPTVAGGSATGAGNALSATVSASIMPAGAVLPAAVAAPGAPGASGMPQAKAQGIGFATGGAQDVENFRANVEAGYLPLPTDVSFEGVVKDYYFDTSPTDANNTEPCTELFCPLYSLAVSPDPLLAAADGEAAPQPDVFMAVGLDSGMTAEQFKRKQLNLVILLDVSGSMAESFNAYYYDQLGNMVEQSMSAEEQAKTKLDVAKEVVQGMLDKLAPGDRVSIVLFESSACTPKALGLVSCTDMAKLKAGFAADVVPLGSTNLQAGLDQATSQLKGCRECMGASLEDTENRIVLITDAEPNTGDFTTEGLAARLKANAADGIFTTIVGVGLDFNTELIDAISRVKGLNYYSVHTPGEFKQRLNDQFDFMVTPLVFDLELKVDPASLAGGWKMLAVYGSPNPNDTALSADGGIMRINTLFPSPQTEDGIKGGVVLVRMEPPTDGSNAPLRLAATYSDRAGVSHNSVRTVELPATVADSTAGGEGYFQSSGVEKAVLLARYTDLMKGWLLDQWPLVDSSGGPIFIPLSTCDTFPSSYCPILDAYGLQRMSSSCTLQHWLLPKGCILPPPPPVMWPLLGRWERQSEKLAVNPDAKQAMRDFLPYFTSEAAAVGDDSLAQESDIMTRLTNV